MELNVCLRNYANYNNMDLTYFTTNSNIRRIREIFILERNTITVHKLENIYKDTKRNMKTIEWTNINGIE